MSSIRLWREEKCSERKVSETTGTKEYAFVLDADGKQLSPMRTEKAWCKIRHNQVKLINKYPMVVQLYKIVPKDEICKDEVRCGIDDGGLHVGIALVQKCQTKNKVLLKGTIEQRNDVKKKMEQRKMYRQNRRYYKKYREERFNNRASSKRNGRIAPSILQKKQATMRIINQLNKWINISGYWLEDVAIDMRVMTDGYKSYGWQYQKSNRLDENIRKAVILRDGCKCMECGKSNCRLEVHHIRPRRNNGSNTMSNMITLCSKCHDKTEGKEERFIDRYFSMINGSDDKNLNYASHVMIGKTWLRGQLSNLATLHLTTGGNTANKRIDWNIEKTHSNDAICITDLMPDDVNVKDWVIKPIRNKCKGKTDNVDGFKYRDYIEYTYINGETYRGYVTALYPNKNALNFKSQTKHCKNVRTKKCKLLWRFNRIYWF